MDARMALTERRFKIGVLGNEDLMTLLQPYDSEFNSGRVVRMPCYYNLPTDAIIKSVLYDFELDAFKVLFAHDSFDPVPTGQAPPYMTLEIKFLEIPVIGND